MAPGGKRATGGRKARTGCLTCKARRIKCDETKPACQRCTNSGRHCEGYVVIFKERNQADFAEKAVTTTRSAASSSQDPSRVSSRAQTRTTTPRLRDGEDDTSSTELVLAGTSTMPFSDSLLYTVSVDSNELRALSFFYNRSASMLSGWYDRGFWSDVVCRIGYQEPCVRHAMVAIGAMHEQYESSAMATSSTPFGGVFAMRAAETTAAARSKASGGSTSLSPPPTAPSAQTEMSSFAMKQYNKALMGLVARLSSETERSVDLALLACVMFICLDSLSRDTKGALKHLQAGIRIIRGWRAQQDATRSDSIPSLSAESTMTTTTSSYGTNRSTDYASRASTPYITMDEGLIEENLIPMFTRLGLLSALFGQPEDIIGLQSPSVSNIVRASRETGIPPRYPTMDEARGALMQCSAQVLGFINEVGFAKFSQSGITDEQLAEQKVLLRMLDDWNDALEELVARMARPPEATVRLLKMHFHTAWTWLATCTSNAESTLDAYMDRFEEIVNLAEPLIDPTHSLRVEPDDSEILPPGVTSSSSNKNSAHNIPTFSFEMAVVPILYFVTIKCRHPILRRRALHMLSVSERREGLWDSRAVARVAWRVIQLEEQQKIRGNDRFFAAQQYAEAEKVPIPSEHEYLSSGGTVDGAQSIWPAIQKLVEDETVPFPHEDAWRDRMRDAWTARADAAAATEPAIVDEDGGMTIDGMTSEQLAEGGFCPPLTNATGPGHPLHRYSKIMNMEDEMNYIMGTRDEDLMNEMGLLQQHALATGKPTDYAPPPKTKSSSAPTSGGNTTTGQGSNYTTDKISLPAESSRIYDTNIGSRREDARSIRVLTFVTKPEGMPGDWFIRRESITNPDINLTQRIPHSGQIGEGFILAALDSHLGLVGAPTSLSVEALTVDVDALVQRAAQLQMDGFEKRMSSFPSVGGTKAPVADEEVAELRPGSSPGTSVDVGRSVGGAWHGGG